MSKPETNMVDRVTVAILDKRRIALELQLRDAIDALRPFASRYKDPIESPNVTWDDFKEAARVVGEYDSC